MKRSSVDVVLDATYESVLAVGVKRTTFADVARRAGMSRATLYTHFPHVEAAVAALMTREFSQIVLQARGRAVSTSSGARAQLLATIAEVADAVPRHPLFAKVVEVDAEALMPYLVERLGSVQRRALAVTHELVRMGQGDGTIKPGDPAVLSHVVVTTVQAFLVSSRLAAAELGAGAVIDGLLDLLDRGLSP